MKLWLKQTLVTLAVILLSVSVCLYHFVAQETDQLIQQAIQSGARDTAVFCDHLSTLERTSTAYDMDIITRQALIQYKFSTYAHLLQTGDCTWSLVMDGQYYYNTASCQPMETLPMAEDAVAASRIVERGGTHLLISAQSMSVLQTPLTVYRAANIESTYQHINDLTRAAQLSLLGCLLLCGVLLPLLLRKTLAPLRKLAQISDKIACGAYDLRANISADDEVGELARAFDHMADTVEQKNCRFGGYRPAALAYEGRCMGYEYDGGMSSLRGDLFIFTRKVNGAPTAWTSEDCQAYDNFEDTYQLKTPYEALRIIIDRYDGAIWMQWQAPHTIDLASGQAATLLPFDQIVTIAAQLLPLKYQFQEQYLAYRNQDANRMTVNRITLSYSRVQNRDNPENFSMLPVWDFFDADDPAKSLLTISAVDGTVIDRGFGY